MEFIISKEAFLDNLQKVSGPTATKQNFPVLNSVLITALDNKLKFTATDLDITTITLQETKVIKQGQVVIPMKKIISIIRELPFREITVEKKQNNLLIKCEQIEFNVSTINPDEFPKIQEEKGISLIKIFPRELEEMIRLTSFCVGSEDMSYVLGGILFEITENKINMVSTDGKRLAFIQKTLPLQQPEIKTKISFIVPIKAINEINKLIKEKDDEGMYLFIEKNRVGFDFENMQFIAHTTEGEFPDYTQYIPKDSRNKLTVNRKSLLSALRRANLLSISEHQIVKLELKKNNLFIHKNTPQLGEVKEDVNVLYDGAHLEVGFNPNYLLDVLKNINDNNVSIDFLGQDKPAVFRKDGYIYLLLPVKI